MQSHTRMSHKVLVSFIVPVYNIPADFLSECVESIMALSLCPSEREIIIVDDGSTSDVLHILRNVSDEIIYIRQENKGLSSARNAGIQAARGQYIQFVDGDDRLICNPYNHCLDIIRSKDNDMVIFDFSRTLSAVPVYHDQKPTNGVDYLLHNNIKGSACGYLFKRSVLGDLRFTPGIFHEDEEFTPLLLLRAGKICVTDAQAYYYRRREDTITSSKEQRRVLKRLNDTEFVIHSLSRKAEGMPQKEKCALQRRVAQLTMDYIYQIIIETKNRHYLDRKLQALLRDGFFPLPEQSYTRKYQWFRRISRYDIGLNILLLILPLIKRER